MQQGHCPYKISGSLSPPPQSQLTITSLNSFFDVQLRMSCWSMQMNVFFIRPMLDHCLAMSVHIHNLCMMSPHYLLCSCQCSCWDWTDVTMAIIGATFTWPLLANVELNCWIYKSCHMDLLQLLHRIVKVVTCIFRPLPKCSKRNAKDNSKSSNHLLSEHFQCADIYKHVLQLQ